MASHWPLKHNERESGGMASPLGFANAPLSVLSDWWMPLKAFGIPGVKFSHHSSSFS